MGACPEWYPLIQAARYLGVPPWELAERPLIWREWALAAMAADNQRKPSQQNNKG